MDDIVIPVDQVQTFGNLADFLSRSHSIQDPTDSVPSLDSIPYFTRDEYLQAQCPYPSRKRKRSVFEGALINI